MGRAAPRPDTMNASEVRALVPVEAWCASSVRGSHTARTSSRTLFQTCIPAPRIGRHIPVPRGDLHSISPSIPTFHRPRTASKGASNDRRTGKPHFALDRERHLGSPWRVYGTGASAGRTRSAMRAPVSRSLSSSNLASKACPLADAPLGHAGECFGAGTRRPSRSTCLGCSTRPARMCPGTPRPGFGAIDATVLYQNHSTACAGRTMYESSKMSKVGIPIDRMSSGS